MEGLNTVLRLVWGCVLLALVGLVGLPPQSASCADAEVLLVDQDTEEKIELGPSSRSRSFLRPKKAEYFWWDAPSGVRVELRFDDGSREEAESEKSFSKRIEEVVFINRTKDKVEILLRSRF